MCALSEGKCELLSNKKGIQYTLSCADPRKGVTGVKPIYIEKNALNPNFFLHQIFMFFSIHLDILDPPVLVYEFIILMGFHFSRSEPDLVWLLLQ